MRTPEFAAAVLPLVLGACTPNQLQVVPEPPDRVYHLVSQQDTDASGEGSAPTATKESFKLTECSNRQPDTSSIAISDREESGMSVHEIRKVTCLYNSATDGVLASQILLYEDAQFCQLPNGDRVEVNHVFQDTERDGKLDLQAAYVPSYEGKRGFAMESCIGSASCSPSDHPDLHVLKMPAIASVSDWLVGTSDIKDCTNILKKGKLPKGLLSN